MPLPQITWQDAQQLPEDGNRHEAIGGELYMTPAPRVRHQRISHVLEVALDRLLDEPGHGIVLSAPTGVEHPITGEGVQPDILFVSNVRREIIGEDWLRGAPDLVVEILSPTTASRDRSVKLDFYRRLGVTEYWIVDPDIEALEVWRFGEEPEFTRYTNTPHMDRIPVRVASKPEDPATSETLGEIRLGEIFKRI